MGFKNGPGQSPGKGKAPETAQEEIESMAMPIPTINRRLPSPISAFNPQYIFNRRSIRIVGLQRLETSDMLQAMWKMRPLRLQIEYVKSPTYDPAKEWLDDIYSYIPIPAKYSLGFYCPSCEKEKFHWNFLGTTSNKHRYSVTCKLCQIQERKAYPHMCEYRVCHPETPHIKREAFFCGRKLPRTAFPCETDIKSAVSVGSHRGIERRCIGCFNELVAARLGRLSRREKGLFRMQFLSSGDLQKNKYLWFIWDAPETGSGEQEDQVHSLQEVKHPNDVNSSKPAGAPGQPEDQNHHLDSDHETVKDGTISVSSESGQPVAQVLHSGFNWDSLRVDETEQIIDDILRWREQHRL